MAEPQKEKLFPLRCKEHYDSPSFYACLEEFDNPHVVRPQSWYFDTNGELVTLWGRRLYPYVIRDCFDCDWSMLGCDLTTYWGIVI